MDKKEIVQNIIKDNGGVARTSDFNCYGMKNYELSSLCKDNAIERIGHGLYRIPDTVPPSEELLIKVLLPQGIVCAESALFHYGYSDFAPRAWTIAMPRTSARTVSRIQQVPIKAHYVTKEFFELGRVQSGFNGVYLSVYNRERVICDCFRHRARLDSETFVKAVKAYAGDKRKDLKLLSKYAEKMGIYEKVMDVMEVLLND